MVIALVSNLVSNVQSPCVSRDQIKLLTQNQSS